MEESDIRLLEHTAIRYVTKMDYKVWKELELKGFIFKKDYPVLSELRRILKDMNSNVLSERSLTLISDAVKQTDKVKASMDKYADIIQKNNIAIISGRDPLYPMSWENLSGMPPIIFARGNLRILDDLTCSGTCSIVGSRTPGRYALYATGEFTKELIRRDVVIVSGLALGIDRKAHETCLDEGGKTIAFVPGGCDIIYPYQNRDIYERLCESGLVLSELPPGQEVIKQYFPSRNRLISALGDACLIMEAGVHSGTLHTASFAAAQGKDVYVLPNSIYSDNSLGGLLLLRDGAEVLIDSDTVYDSIRTEISNRMMQCEEFLSKCDSRMDLSADNLRRIAKENPGDLEEHEWEMILCDEISERPKNIDELAVSLGIPFSYLSALITSLETEGRIANEHGKYVLTIHGR